MNLTARLKTWLSENCGVAATATDAEFTKAALDALSNGKLDAAKYAELSNPETTKPDVKTILAEMVKQAM